MSTTKTTDQSTEFTANMEFLAGLDKPCEGSVIVHTPHCYGGCKGTGVVARIDWARVELIGDEKCFYKAHVEGYECRHGENCGVGNCISHLKVCNGIYRAATLAEVTERLEAVIMAESVEIKPIYEPGFRPWSAAVPRLPGQGEWRIGDTPTKATVAAVVAKVKGETECS